MIWEAFPFEIRLIILDHVPRRYACVSREWQAVLEPRNFERVILFPECLRSFGRIVRGYKRRLVKHIWLRIPLKTYRCDECVKRESFKMVKANNAIFVEAVTALFQILATWDKSKDVDEKGLTLELCAYSTSDSKHIFKELNFQHNPYDEPCEYFRTDSSDPERMAPRFHDPSHLWRNGRRVPESPQEREIFQLNRMRLLGHGLCVMPPKILGSARSVSDLLPNVEVVTKFLFRRQYHRYIHPDGLCQLLGSLIGLKQITYEPTKKYDNDDYLEDYRYELLIENCLPRSLKQLTIFETRDEQFEWEYHDNPFYSLIYPITIYNPRFGPFLAKASQNLECLSASFFVHAEDFFRSFLPQAVASPESLTWVNLRSLALTSDLLAPANPPASMNQLLVAASIAARAMPVLRIMEIWNGKNKLAPHGGQLHEEHGSIFRYHVDGKFPEATITWHGTWQLKFSSQVIQCWTKTAQRHGSNELVVVYEQMIQDGTRFPTSVLRHLRLRNIVLDPISYRQIQLSGELDRISPIDHDPDVA